MKKNPYEIIKHLHVTEKTMILQGLKDATSNPSIAKYEKPKYVFVVDCRANKREIADALEEIYKEQNIKVSDVNTINIKGKKRRVRGRQGIRSSIKKAVVTLEKGDSIETI